MISPGRLFAFLYSTLLEVAFFKSQEMEPKFCKLVGGNYDSRPSRFGDGISIALTIHSLDPLQTSNAQLRKIN